MQNTLFILRKVQLKTGIKFIFNGRTGEYNSRYISTSLKFIIILLNYRRYALKLTNISSIQILSTGLCQKYIQ